MSAFWWILSLLLFGIAALGILIWRDWCETERRYREVMKHWDQRQ